MYERNKKYFKKKIVQLLTDGGLLVKVIVICFIAVNLKHRRKDMKLLFKLAPLPHYGMVIKTGPSSSLWHGH